MGSPSTIATTQETAHSHIGLQILAVMEAKEDNRCRSQQKKQLVYIAHQLERKHTLKILDLELK